MNAVVELYARPRIFCEQEVAVEVDVVAEARDLRGCSDAQSEMGPVRLEGEVERHDGRIEQYRALFIPVGVKPNSLTCFAFGAFNSRVLPPK